MKKEIDNYLDEQFEELFEKCFGDLKLDGLALSQLKDRCKILYLAGCKDLLENIEK